jgi:hypothetical protein
MPHIEAGSPEDSFEILVDFRLEDEKKSKGHLTMDGVTEKIANTLHLMIDKALAELEVYPYLQALNTEGVSLETLVKTALAEKISASLEVVNERS